MNPNDPDFSQLLIEFKKGGWVMAVLGGLGMLARMILTKAKYNTWVWIRNIIAGGIVGVLCYFALYNTSIDPLYKSVLCSISGSIAPELFELLRKKLIKQFK